MRKLDEQVISRLDLDDSASFGESEFVAVTSYVEARKRLMRPVEISVHDNIGRLGRFTRPRVVAVYRLSLSVSVGQ
jgi:hypothetical protein